METVQEQELVEKLYIYIGMSVDGQYKYRTISSMDVNNGESIKNIQNVGRASFGGRVFKRNNTIGAIFKVKETPDGKSIKYNGTDYPVGNWKNREDCAAWRLEHDAGDTVRKITKEGKSNELREFLKPLRSVYRDGTPQLRAAMLAEIISIMTG
jgi:hypothetical protein